MYKNQTFPTRSHYEGSWNKSVQSMDGFGTYTYPDGSEYRGYFKAGLFDGYGSLKLLHPQKFIIKAYFEEGICKIIHELHFSDGMKFNCRIEDDGNISTDNWKYCTARDRRFHDEIRFGIDPFGPYARTTSRKSSFKIPRGTYDTAEGYYQPKTGFLTVTENTDEESKMRFISCPHHREWIFNYCRFVPKGFRRPVEPSSEFAFDIIACNMNSNEHSDIASCSCRGNVERERYFGNLCYQQWTSDIPDFDEDPNRPHLSRTSSTEESFDYRTLKFQEEEDVCKIDHFSHRPDNYLLSEKDRRLHEEKVRVMKYIN